MKIGNIIKVLFAGVVLASCHNQEQVFPDYDGGLSTYFAYQYPVRTIVLGESETFDTSLDNQHKCIIYGAMGGAYKGKDLSVSIAVDNSLIDNLYFDAAGTSPVKPMPDDYYDLSGYQLDYAGNYMGGVEVTLTDKFFEDPDALKNTYVIPVIMSDVVKGDAQILTGTPAVADQTPARTDQEGWKVLPKDYTLYCVKYVNPWHGSWLRRGVDEVTGFNNHTLVRHEESVEYDEVVDMTTQSINTVTVPVYTELSKTVVTEVHSNYALHMTNSEIKSANWATQVWYTLSKPMKSGKKYTLKGKAAATEQYDWCSIFLQSTSSDAQNFNHGMSFSTEWKEFTVTITPDQDVFDKITWNLGDKVITLMIDDVVLTEEGSTENLIVSSGFEDQSTKGWSEGSEGVISLGPGEGGFISKEVETVEKTYKTCMLNLTFDNDNNCTVSSATDGMTASGSGKFVKDGEKLAWGNKDRDAIYLEYEVDFGVAEGFNRHVTKDTLVARSREIALETYVPTYKK